VSADYDPARAYPVRFHLHGGVTVPEDNQPRGSGGIGALAGGEPHIYVVPSGWVEAPWWSDRQARNLREILRTVKRAYTVDENRVSISGVSGSSAPRVGLRRGDIVMSVDRIALPAGEDFDQALTRCRPANPIGISVLRDGAQVELKGIHEPVKVGDGSLRLFDRVVPADVSI
jgi:hypothetical protein